MAKQPLFFAVPKNFDPSGQGDAMPDRFNFSFDPVTLELCLIDNTKNPALPASEVACWDSKATDANNKLNRVEYNVALNSGEAAQVLTPFLWLGETNQRYEGTPNSWLILVRTNGDATAEAVLKDSVGAVISTIEIPNDAGYKIYSAPIVEFALPIVFTFFVPEVTVTSAGGQGSLDVDQSVLINLPLIF